MNSPNDNIHTTLGVAQDKKVHIQVLGRGAHSPPKADHNWKPINAFAMHLVRQIRAAQSICTRVGPKHQDLHVGNWNITSLNGKIFCWVISMHMWVLMTRHKRVLLEDKQTLTLTKKKVFATVLCHQWTVHNEYLFFGTRRSTCIPGTETWWDSTLSLISILSQQTCFLL